MLQAFADADTVVYEIPEIPASAAAEAAAFLRFVVDGDKADDVAMMAADAAGGTYDPDDYHADPDESRWQLLQIWEITHAPSKRP